MKHVLKYKLSDNLRYTAHYVNHMENITTKKKGKKNCVVLTNL